MFESSRRGLSLGWLSRRPGIPGEDLEFNLRGRKKTIRCFEKDTLWEGGHFQGPSWLAGNGNSAAKEGIWAEKRPHVRDHAPHLGGPRLGNSLGHYTYSGSGALPIAGEMGQKPV